MDLNRNHYFLAGMVLLFIGYQFRQIESFTLNAKTTHFIEMRMQRAQSAMADVNQVGYQQPAPRINPVVTPPRWLGLALLAVGTVLTMYSFSLPRPNG